MKGSQLHFRNYVNNHCSLLNIAIFSCSTSLLSFVKGELNIEWKSPLLEDGYMEYQDVFLTLYFNNEMNLVKHQRLKGSIGLKKAQYGMESAL
jgi:hypothetical protein